jgi:hypothetical protein
MYIQIPYCWFITFLWLFEGALILIFLPCFVLKGILERVHWKRNLEPRSGIFFCSKGLLWNEVLEGFFIVFTIIHEWYSDREEMRKRELMPYGTLFLWMLKFLQIILNMLPFAHIMKCVLNWCRRRREIKKQYQNYSSYCSWIHVKLNSMRQIITLL